MGVADRGTEGGGFLGGIQGGFTPGVPGGLRGLCMSECCMCCVWVIGMTRMVGAVLVGRCSLMDLKLREEIDSYPYEL